MDNHSGFGVVLWATDVFALAGFLEQVAGLAQVTRHPGFAELEAGAVTIAIHADEAYRGHPWFSALAREGLARGIGAELRFEVEDVQRSYSAALRLGAQAIAPPYEMEGARECTIMGPDGYLISLWQSVY